MQRLVRMAIVASVCVLSIVSTALAQADPPARVGRISFVLGTVSFHDADDAQWSPALLNHPVTTGGALWTEPGGRAELVVAGNRLRLQGSTELQVVTLDDALFRLRLPEGRIDWRAAGVPASQPFEVLTPRGAVSLLEDGDYVIEAGGTATPTRVAVRSGLAQFAEPDGRVVNLRPGEIAVASGTAPVMLAVVRQAPPPMPPEWAARDRVYVHRPAPPQYVPPTVTGYEDLDAYGSWIPASDYGPVWAPRYVPVGWAPYRHGRWVFVKPWGWTWVDDSPWGFAPFHYGRWIIINQRWCWVPPARHARPVYAPAVVGFIGGPVTAIAIGAGRPGPAVGWFPLGPREVYVPPYTANRAYIRGLNAPNVTTVADIDRRIDWAERREARRDDSPWANQRYATVVPADAFVRSQPTRRAALGVSADRIARAEVAPVAAPPAVTPATATAPPAAGVSPKPPGPPPAAATPGQPGAPTTPGQPPAAVRRDAPGAPPPADAPVIHRTPLGDMPTLGRPQRVERPPAPGPTIARTTPAPTGVTTVTPPAGAPTTPPAAGPKPGQPEVKQVPQPAGGPPPLGAPPAAPTPPSAGTAPPAVVTPPALPPTGATSPAGTRSPSTALPPLRGLTPQAAPKAVEPPPPAVAPTVVSPKAPEVAPGAGTPKPSVVAPPPTVITPPPPASQPLGASPKPAEPAPGPAPKPPAPTATPKPPEPSVPSRPVERLAPPPPPQAAPRPAPPPPMPQAAPAPRPVERLAPPPPPQAAPAPRPAPPLPPPSPAPALGPAPTVKPTVPPPPPPQPQQQQQQQREDERRKLGR